MPAATCGAHVAVAHRGGALGAQTRGCGDCARRARHALCKSRRDAARPSRLLKQQRHLSPRMISRRRARRARTLPLGATRQLSRALLCRCGVYQSAFTALVRVAHAPPRASALRSLIARLSGAPTPRGCCHYLIAAACARVTRNVSYRHFVIEHLRIAAFRGEINNIKHCATYRLRAAGRARRRHNIMRFARWRRSAWRTGIAACYAPRFSTHSRFAAA